MCELEFLKAQIKDFKAKIEALEAAVMWMEAKLANLKFDGKIVPGDASKLEAYLQGIYESLNEGVEAGIKVINLKADRIGGGVYKVSPFRPGQPRQDD
jgi:hypothetical protein